MVGAQPLGQVDGLLEAFLGQRTKLVIRLPGGPVAGVGVTNQKDGHRFFHAVAAQRDNAVPSLHQATHRPATEPAR